MSNSYRALHGNLTLIARVTHSVITCNRRGKNINTMSRPTAIVTKLATAIDERLSEVAKSKGMVAEALRAEILKANKDANFGLNTTQVVVCGYLASNHDFSVTGELAAIEQADMLATITANVATNVGTSTDAITAAIALLQKMLQAAATPAVAEKTVKEIAKK